MKISKTLLGAILAGIAIQTTVASCNKKEQAEIKPQTEKQTATPATAPEPCPACGMG